MREFVTNLPIGVSVQALESMDDAKVQSLAAKTLSLINLNTTDTNRGTHYSTKEQLEEAREALHREVFVLDRTIYGCLFCLSGVTDFSKQQAVMTLLSNPWVNGQSAVLTPDHERQIIDRLVWELPSNRMLNLFIDFRENRVNNSRTRTTVLPKILNSGSLELWSVKYRRKVSEALEHAWNRKTTGTLRSILKKGRWSQKESGIIEDNINKFVQGGPTIKRKVQECISFILGNDNFKGNKFTPELLQQFYAARKNLADGNKLPMEVLDGIRSTYHKGIPKTETLKVSKDTLTTKQKKLVQKKAKEAGVEVEFDPMKYGLVDLFLYAFEMGWDDQIARAVSVKSQKAAEGIPARFDKIGVLIDDSFSMVGSSDQKLRPMAVSLAMKETLTKLASDSLTLTSGGQVANALGLIHPKGHTSLAMSLIKLLKQEPDSIFILSDGYENAPSGRVNEVMQAVRNIGITTPVYLMNPVRAGESAEGIRTLSEHISALPVQDPQAVGSMLFKMLLERDPRRGLAAIVSTVFPQLPTQMRGEQIGR